MFAWLFLAWCAVAIMRDLGVLPLPAAPYLRGLIVALLLVWLIFFRTNIA
jgi:hypothetical protein